MAMIDTGGVLIAGVYGSGKSSVAAEIAGRQIAAAEGVGIEDVTVANDRPVAVVARQVMTWLGWV